MSAQDAPGQVLAADVGGTKTALALAPARAGAEPTQRETFASADWPDFESGVRAFLERAGRPRLAAAAVAAAGPVEDGAVQVTHLPWRIEAAALARALGVPQVALLNDAVATALGMLELPDACFARLQGRGLREPGIVAVLAVGTGLGETLLVEGPGGVRALPSEGGHAGYAPRSVRERALLAHLAGADDAHVAVEEVVSGPGLARVHAFLRGASGRRPGAASRRRAKVGETTLLDPAAITEAALRGDDPLCVEALEIFLASWGSHAGDLLLRGMAEGGLWLGGGIAPRIVEPLRRGPFLASMRAKGRFRDWLAARPVAVCLTSDAALFGALREARRLVGSA